MTTRDLTKAREDIEFELEEIAGTIDFLKGRDSQYIRDNIGDVFAQIENVEQTSIKEFGILIGDIPLDRQADWTPVLQELKNKAGELRKDAVATEASANRKALIGDRQDDELNVANMTAAQKIEAAQNINNANIGLVDDMIKTTGETIEMGDNAITQLNENRETLMRIDGNLTAMQNDLELSKKIIKDFFRNLVSDRLTLAFMFAIVAAILIIIIVVIVKKVKAK